MKNDKNMRRLSSFVLATFLIGGILVAPVTHYAQSAPQEETVVNTDYYKSNQKLITQMTHTSDETAAFDLIAQIKENIMGELGSTKQNIANYLESNPNLANQYRTLNQELGNLFNRLLLASRDLDSFDRVQAEAVLKEYLQVHQ